jgi:hypothetical protein
MSQMFAFDRVFQSRSERHLANNRAKRGGTILACRNNKILHKVLAYFSALSANIIKKHGCFWTKKKFFEKKNQRKNCVPLSGKFSSTTKVYHPEY